MHMQAYAYAYVYLHVYVYGVARLHAEIPAVASMKYKVGSREEGGGSRE